MILHYHDTPIYYTVSGKGPALVFLHGFLESAIIWEDIVPFFKKTHTVITIDLPGFGKSGTISQSHSMELMGDVVFEVLREAKISNYSCVGHSMGGYVVLAMAEKKPSAIKNLILLNSTTYKDNDLRKENRDRAIKFMTTQKRAIVSMAISNLFTETERNKLKVDIESLKKQAFQYSAEGLVAAITGMRDRKDRTEVLKKFTNKKYLISGIYDSIIPIEDSIIQAKNTNSTLFKIEGGHMSWLTHGNEIVKILTLII